MPSDSSLPIPATSSHISRPISRAPDVLDPINLSPEQWLDKVGWPFSVLHLEYICKGSLFDILLSIIKGPDDVEHARYLFKDPQQVIYQKLTRHDWLKELSEIITQRYRPDPKATAYDEKGEFVHRLSQILTLCYGQPLHEIPARNGSTQVLNTVHFGALFARACSLEFDESIGCFFHYNEKKGAWQPLSDHRVRQILINFLVPYMHRRPLLYSGSPMFLDTIISQAKATTLHDPFKPEGYMFGTSNKTLWLKPPKEKAQTPDVEECDNHQGYKIRNAIPIAYDKKNTGCTAFHTMLKNIMEPHDIKMLQYWCGMAILGHNFHHKILILQGKGGSGKSTLANIIERMVGEDNIATLITQRLADRFELSEFFGKTLLVGKDVPDDFLSCKAAPILKSLSGDSNLKAEVKNVQARVRLGGPFNVLVVSNPHLYVNMQDDLTAWTRRLWVIPVNKKKETVELSEYDKKLTESEGAGILYWMLLGAKDVLASLKQGIQFGMNDTQRSNAHSFLVRPDELLDFTNTCIEAKPNGIVTSEELYEAYSSFVARKGKDPVASTVFQKRIVKHLLAIPGVTKPSTIVTKNGGNPVRGYKGLQIKPSSISAD